MDKNTSQLKKEIIKAQQPLFFEGDLEGHFYIIESGSVSVFTKNKFGEKIEIAHLKSGDIVGEMALVDKGARTASAVALTDCQVIKVSESEYQKLISELPLWASSMIKNLSRRLKKMNELAKVKDSL